MTPISIKDQIIAVEVARIGIDQDSQLRAALTAAIVSLKLIDYTDKTPQEITAINHADLREIAHYFGGWPTLRLVIDELEALDIEAANERFQNSN